MKNILILISLIITTNLVVSQENYFNLTKSYAYDKFYNETPERKRLLTVSKDDKNMFYYKTTFSNKFEETYHYLFYFNDSGYLTSEVDVVPFSYDLWIGYDRVFSESADEVETKYNQRFDVVKQNDGVATETKIYRNLQWNPPNRSNSEYADVIIQKVKWPLYNTSRTRIIRQVDLIRKFTQPRFKGVSKEIYTKFYDDDLKDDSMLYKIDKYVEYFIEDVFAPMIWNFNCINFGEICCASNPIYGNYGNKH